MQIVTEQAVKGKKVLLRYDIDVALRKSSVISNQSSETEVAEDFKLKAGLETLKLCIENASKTIIIGHLGRPFKTADEEQNGNPQDLSARPIQRWFESELGEKVDFAKTLDEAQKSSAKIVLLENIRFFHGEVEGDVDFAHKLASLGDVYVMEAFSSHNKAVSTTILPTLLPHFAGTHFVKEVEVLLNVRNNPKKPFIGIMGGAKVKDKLPVIIVLSKSADAVLVGGKLVHEIRDQNIDLPKNVMVGKLNEDGFDIASETTESWKNLIKNAAMIVWNGPVGKFEDPKYNQTEELIKAVLDSKAEIVIGGGDSVASLSQAGLLEEAESKGFSVSNSEREDAKTKSSVFISVGGGAMLKLISDGTLPTIQALA